MASRRLPVLAGAGLSSPGGNHSASPPPGGITQRGGRVRGREQFRAAVRARLARFEAERDPSVLLRQRTLDEAARLAGALDDEDVESVRLSQ